MVWVGEAVEVVVVLVLAPVVVVGRFLSASVGAGYGAAAGSWR